MLPRISGKHFFIAHLRRGALPSGRAPSAPPMAGCRKRQPDRAPHGSWNIPKAGGKKVKAKKENSQIKNTTADKMFSPSVSGLF